VRYLVIFILLAIPSVTFSAEDCSDDAIGLDETSHITEQLFFRGTCHYRKQEYALSAKYWTELSLLEDVDALYQTYQVDSLNNLGYLTFYGYGVSENKQQAIEYWKRAVALGHFESEYHLCHAHAEQDEPTYNPSQAKQHCEKAYLIYNGMPEPDEEVLNDIRGYLSELDSH
jgi:TPR repeat protein